MYSCSVLHFYCMEHIFTIYDEIDFRTRACPPIVELATGLAVVNPRPDMLGNKSLQCGTQFFFGSVQGTRWTQHRKDTSVIKVELWVCGDRALGHPGKHRDSE